MSYLEKGRVWQDYLLYVDRSINRLAIVNQGCEDAINSMKQIDEKVYADVIKNWGYKQLPNERVFAMVFYKRNMSYLQSAYILASIGFVGPSSNVTRTAFETLLRHYLFIVEKQEAAEYFQVIGTPQEYKYHREKGMSYMRQKLYSAERGKVLKELYSILCTFSHPDIKGSNLDYPNYTIKQVEDILRTILYQIYGNIEAFAESFYSLLEVPSKELIKQALENISFDNGHVPTIEPDVEPYASQIRLKNGNFLQVL